MELSPRAILSFLPPTKLLPFLRKRFSGEDGEEVCPIGIVEDPRLYELLGVEADLRDWNAAPWEGPTSDWPVLEYRILQHIRGISNIVAAEKDDPKSGSSQDYREYRSSRE